MFHWLNKPLGAHLKGWKKACTGADLTDLKFHDLRRSAVPNMERAGIPRNVATSITGHCAEAVVPLLRHRVCPGTSKGPEISSKSTWVSSGAEKPDGHKTGKTEPESAFPLS